MAIAVGEEAPRKKRSNLRYLLPAFAVGYAAKKWVRPALLPHGPAVEVPKINRPIYSPIDYSNDSLRFKHGKLQKIYERVQEGQEPLLVGPETIVFGENGAMYVLSEDCNLLLLSDFEQVSDQKQTAKVTKVMDLGMGRPLGGRIVGNTIYIADALLGLVRVQDFLNKGAKVELLASRVKDGDGNWSQILFADDVAIGPKTGMVYFSDASEIAPDRVESYSWDVLHTSKVDYARGNRTGRLLRYDPKTSECSVLATGIWFANGIAVDIDETFVMVSETFAGRALKYNIEKGTLSTMVDEFPGYPDGADCSFSSGLCYAPIPLPEDKIMHLITKLPHPFDAWIRTLLMMLPKRFAPEASPYGGIVELIPGDESTGGKMNRLLQDPNGQDIAFITGVTLHQDKIYLGSLKNSFVGVYDLH